MTFDATWNKGKSCVQSFNLRNEDTFFVRDIIQVAKIVCYEIA